MGQPTANLKTPEQLQRERLGTALKIGTSVAVPQLPTDVVGGAAKMAVGAGGLPVSFAADLGRNALSLVTGNDPSSNVGGAFSRSRGAMDLVSQGSQQLVQGLKPIVQGVQTVGGVVTGTGPRTAAVVAPPVVPAVAPAAAPAPTVGPTVRVTSEEVARATQPVPVPVSKETEPALYEPGQPNAKGDKGALNVVPSTFFTGPDPYTVGAAAPSAAPANNGDSEILEAIRRITNPPLAYGQTVRDGVRRPNLQARTATADALLNMRKQNNDATAEGNRAGVAQQLANASVGEAASKLQGQNITNQTSALTLAQQQRVNDLQTKLLASTDAAEQQTLLQQLNVLGGKGGFELKTTGGGTDIDGKVLPQRVFRIDSVTGQTTEIGGGTLSVEAAKAAALDAVAKGASKDQVNVRLKAQYGIEI